MKSEGGWIKFTNEKEKLVRTLNLKHLFLGEIDQGSLKGFHHAKSYPDRIIKITRPPDKFGIYEAIYEWKGLSKKSTFFPDQWSRDKVLKKVNEACNNIIVRQQNGFIGKTTEGIEIQFWFNKDSTIASIYPYM